MQNAILDGGINWLNWKRVRHRQSRRGATVMKQFSRALTARVVANTLGFVLLAGCGNVHDAKEAVRTKLKDPSSATFSEVRACDDPDYVMGLVNGKNTFGAMAGDRPFIYSAKDGDTLVHGEEEQSRSVVTQAWWINLDYWCRERRVGTNDPEKFFATIPPEMFDRNPDNAEPMFNYWKNEIHHQYVRLHPL